MRQPMSRLAQLMQQLGITGRELGNALHVDHSLISKWKNSHRRIPTRDDTLGRVADYLIQKDREKQQDVLLNLLGLPALPSDDQLKRQVVQWLENTSYPSRLDDFSVVSDEQGLHYTCPVKVYTGEDGRQEAVLKIYETLLSHAQPTEMIFMTQENPTWLNVNPRFIAKLRQNVLAAVKQGHLLTYINWLTHPADTIENLISQWLPLQLQARVETLYYPLYRPFAMPLTLYVIPGKAALVGTHHESGPQHQHTILFQDQATVNHYEKVIRGYRQEAAPLLEYHQPQHLSSLIRKLWLASRNYGTQSVFLHARQPSALLLPTDSSLPLLETDPFKDFVQALQQQDPDIFTLIQHPQSYFADKTIHHVYRLSSLRQACRQKMVHDPFLSNLSGQLVQYPQPVFRKVLGHLIHSLQHHDNIKLALLSDDLYDQVHWPNLLLIANDLFLAWGDWHKHATLTGSESTLLHAFESFSEKRWQQIPTVCRDQTQVLSQLTSLLKA